MSQKSGIRGALGMDTAYLLKLLVVLAIFILLLIYAYGKDGVEHI